MILWKGICVIAVTNSVPIVAKKLRRKMKVKITSEDFLQLCKIAMEASQNINEVVNKAVIEYPLMSATLSHDLPSKTIEVDRNILYQLMHIKNCFENIV
jgi:CRISPR/Cas system CSM-associated protein Csm5 (group 7 of RAMP superfamily)